MLYRQYISQVIHTGRGIILESMGVVQSFVVIIDRMESVTDWFTIVNSLDSFKQNSFNLWFIIDREIITSEHTVPISQINERVQSAKDNVMYVM